MEAGKLFTKTRRNTDRSAVKEKREMIKDLEQNKLERDKRRIAALAALILVLTISVFIYMSGSDILDMYNNKSNIGFDKKIKVSESIQPFSTSINNTGTVKFINKRDNKAVISFQTKGIDQEIILEPGEAGYFRADKYNNLPRTNYFSLEKGGSGQIIIEP